MPADHSDSSLVAVLRAFLSCVRSGGHDFGAAGATACRRCGAEPGAPSLASILAEAPGCPVCRGKPDFGNGAWCVVRACDGPAACHGHFPGAPVIMHELGTKKKGR